MSLPANTLPTPLHPDAAGALSRLAEGLDGSALLWASGYLAGMAHSLARSDAAPTTVAPVPVAATQPATITLESRK